MKRIILFFIGVFCIIFSSCNEKIRVSESIEIGSRLELFVDSLMVDRLEGDAELYLHKPESKEVVLADEKPWESRINYVAVMKDGNIFRMYYRGFHHNSRVDDRMDARGEIMCYAESRDGINWVKPELGLFLYEGSPKNNIVLGGDPRKYPATEKWSGDLGTGLGFRGDMVPFINESPGVTEDSRYLALIRGCRGTCQIAEGRSDYGMYPFKSPDGFNWTIMSDKPVITRGRFDSQNLGFWDAEHGRFVAFVRDVSSPGDVGEESSDTEAVAKGLIRDIRVCTSNDFVNWTDPEFVKYPGAPREHLYTNAVIPYERAPHVLLGFPTRFYVKEAQTEPVFMASRDGGSTFHRWPDALIPKDAPMERDGNRGNYMVNGLLRGNEREYYVYATEGYDTARIRRFTYRVDGFVSVRANSGGEVVTPPIVFRGSTLWINYSAREGGSVCVEVQDAGGSSLKRLRLEDCLPMTGDSIEKEVRWQKGTTSLGRIEGKSVRLRFVLKNADLFSFRFD